MKNGMEWNWNRESVSQRKHVESSIYLRNEGSTTKVEDE
jgi:hypothetical protein